MWLEPDYANAGHHADTTLTQKPIHRHSGEIRQAQVLVAVLAHPATPDIDPSHRDLAEHHGVAVVPARARKSRDKAKAEVGVQVVERWILAARRNRQFLSLDALNSTISVLLERLNHRPFRKLPGSRHSTFKALDRSALRPLLEQPYVYVEWRRRGCPSTATSRSMGTTTLYGTSW